MEMAPGALPRPGKVPEQRLSVPRISPSVPAALQRFLWISSELFRVFGSEDSYKRRRQGRWRARGPTPPMGATRAGPRLGGCDYVVNVSIIFDVPCLFCIICLMFCLHFEVFLYVFLD